VKKVTLPIEGLTLAQLLQEAAKHDVVFLTAKGKIRFALMPAEEGDEEVCALKSNPEFMAYLTESKERAKTAPRTSLKEIREIFGIAVETSNSRKGTKK
jgi:hypothetical protein